MPVEFRLEPTGVSGDTLFKQTMSYDGSGRRISKTSLRKNVNSDDWTLEQITHYTGIGSEIRKEYHNGELQSTKVVVNMPQGLGRYGIENADGMAKGDEFYLKNHLGSTMMVAQVSSTNASESAKVAAAYDYRAFGEQVTLKKSADKVTENFTGKERDDETELDYFGARYLDPMLGLWISVDPARQFSSPYLYAGNGMNPVNVVDPDGNFLMMGEGQSEEFHDNVTIAIDYLNAYGAAGEIASLHAKDQVIYLKETSKGSYFDPNEMTIYWNPHEAAEAQTKLSFQSDFQAVSPALLLVHESAHANHFIKNPSEYDRLADRCLLPDGKFGNEEERRTILNSEWPAAKKLGEGLRGSWYGRGFYVSDPTQNRRGE